MDTIKNEHFKIKVLAMGRDGNNFVFESANKAAEFFRQMNFRITPKQILRRIKDGKPTQHKEEIFNSSGNIEKTDIYEYFFDELYEG